MTKEEAKSRSEFSKKLFEFDDPLTRTKNSWALCYVEAEKPVPEKLRNSFYEELISSHARYRERLEESIRWFGVRWI